MTLPKVCSVVTGHDAQGRPIIAEDGAPPQIIEFKATEYRT
jgi:hypothetical protein